MSYTGPDFVNDGSPAINAANLNGMVTELERCSARGDEVEDIRAGAYGTVYSSAGDAVRGQVTDLKNSINNLVNGITIINLLNRQWTSSTTMNSHGEYVSSSNARNYGDGVVDISQFIGQTITIKINTSNTTQATYSIRSAGGNLLAKESFTTATNTITIPEDAKEFRLVGQAASNADLPDSQSSIEAYITYTGMDYRSMQKSIVKAESDISEMQIGIQDIMDGIVTIDLLDRQWVNLKTMDSFGVYVDTTNNRYYGDGVVDITKYVGEYIHIEIDNNNTTSVIYSFRKGQNLIEKNTITATTNVLIPTDSEEFRFVGFAANAEKVSESKNSVQAYIKMVGLTFNESQERLAEIPGIEDEIEDINNIIVPVINKTAEMINYIVKATSGKITPSDIALVTRERIAIKNFVSVSIDAGYSVKIYQYANDGTYIGIAHFGLLTYTTTTSNPIKKSDITFDSGADVLVLQVQTDRTSPQEIEPSDIDVVFALVNDRITNLENEMEMVSIAAKANYAYAMTSVLCIGDSLTSGAYYGSTEIWPNRGTSIKQNYPNALARMLCCNTINGGVSGYDATNWYNTKYDEVIDDTEEDENKWFDSVIIWLGTNGGYTDTFATDIEQYGTDYELYATTNVGYLGKIIQRIKTYHPNRFMAICNLYAEPNASGASNKVIGEVAEFFDIPLIDMSDLDHINHPELHYGADNINVHFNKAGNIFLADRIIRNVNNYLQSNPLKCDFGLTVRDDEYYHP